MRLLSFLCACAAVLLAGLSIGSLLEGDAPAAAFRGAAAFVMIILSGFIAGVAPRR